VLLVYSAHHFSMFGSDGQRMYPFDNLTEGSIFLLSSVNSSAFILNSEFNDVYVSRQPVLTPRSPLPLHNEEVLAASQLIFAKYFVVRVCPQLLLLFPMHFAQGNSQRKFLSASEGSCFAEDSIMEEFSWQFFLHWSLFRNIVLFTLLCSEYRRQRLADRLIEQFVVNLLLLAGRPEVENKLFYTLYLVSFGLLVEYALQAVVGVCGRVAVRQRWGNSLLLLVSAVCLVGSALGLFNVWGFFLLALLPFINRENALVVLLKLFFLKEEIWHNGAHFSGLSEIGLLTMWVYTSLPSNKVESTAFWTPERLFSGLLVVGAVFSVESSGSFMDNLVTIYMKVLIVVKMLRIIRK
jgi:hypothetical protein